VLKHILMGQPDREGNKGYVPLREMGYFTHAASSTGGGAQKHILVTWKTSLPRTRLALLEDERSVADDLVARTGRIAGIAQVHSARTQSVPTRRLQ
jgi:hypothetical protein